MSNILQPKRADDFPPEEDFEPVELPRALYDTCTCGVDELMAISAMNRRQVAAALGTTRMEIGRWLKGESAPRKRHQERIEALIQEYEDLARNDPDELAFRIQNAVSEQ